MTETDLRERLLAWPGTAADIKWQVDLVFSVMGKMFCVWCTDDRTPTLSFKVDDERFLEFTDRPGIRPAPYMARARWVQLERPDAIAPDEVHALLRHSYDLVCAKLPEKIQRALQQLQ